MSTPEKGGDESTSCVDLDIPHQYTGGSLHGCGKRRNRGEGQKSIKGQRKRREGSDVPDASPGKVLVLPNI